MSNAVYRKALTQAWPPGQGHARGALALQLNGPDAWAAPGGSNLASLVTTAGDLLLASATGHVGVNNAQPTCALDVSGAVRASAFRDASGHALITSSTVTWQSASSVTFQDDAGQPLAVGAGGTLTCRYFCLGTLVNAEIAMTVGASGSALGSNAHAWTWSLPVTPAASVTSAVVGQALARSASEGVETGTVWCAADGLSVQVMLPGHAFGVTTDAPFAWAAGNTLSMVLAYEAAAFSLPSYATPVAFQQSGVSSNTLGLGLAPATTLPAGSLVLGGNLGVGGQGAPAYTLDVSGAVRASAFMDANGNSLITPELVAWKSAAATFKDDAGQPLAVGAGGSLTCRYFCLGTLVNAEIAMTVGASGSALGSNAHAWTWSLPVTPAASVTSAVVGQALARSASEGVETGTVWCAADGLSVQVMLPGHAFGVTTDAPFAWAAGNTLTMSLAYEAAAFSLPSYATPATFQQSGVSSNTLGIGIAPASTLPAGSLVLGGNLGVGGLSAPAYAIDVSGAVRASGGVFSTLMGSNVTVLGSLSVAGSFETVNAYETHSSNVVIVNAGTGPALSVTQTSVGAQPVAAFYAGSNVALHVGSGGNVGVGKASTTYALDVSGGVNISGETTFAYPPCTLNAMTGTTNILKSQTVTGQAYGNGTYTATLSAEFSTSVSYLYDNVATDRNVCTPIIYSTSSPFAYGGSTTTNGIAGAWYGMQMPSAILLTGVQITPRQAATYCPAGFVFFGSNDGSTWVTLATFTSVVWPTTAAITFLCSSSTAYTMFRVVVTNMVGNSGGYMCFNKLMWYGTASGNPFTLNVTGNANVTGAFSATSKNFKISHPVRPRCNLYHSCVESPRFDLMYRGLVQLTNGRAVVDIDSECNSTGGMTHGTFASICQNPQLFLQNTTSFNRVIGAIALDRAQLTVRGEDESDSKSVISWMVVAERHDADVKRSCITDGSGALICEHEEQ